MNVIKPGSTLKELQKAITSLAELALSDPEVNSITKARDYCYLAQNLLDRVHDDLIVRPITAGPEDKIAFYVTDRLTARQAELLREQGKRVWPDNEIVVFSGGVEVEIVGKPRTPDLDRLMSEAVQPDPPERAFDEQDRSDAR